MSKRCAAGGAESELVGVADAARQLGVTANMLYIWRHRRQGPASFRIGRRVVYRRAVLDEWVRAQELADSRSNPSLNPLNRPLKRVVGYAPRTTRGGAGQRVGVPRKHSID